MWKTRIAAGATAIVLGASGVALATGAGSSVSGSGSGEAEIPSVSLDAGSQVDVTTAADVSDDVATRVTAGAGADASAQVSTTVTTIDDHDDDTTSTTIDDHGDDATTTTPAEHDDDDNLLDVGGIVGAGLTTYTAGTAGSVVLDGMTLVGVTTNPGWTVSIEEATQERVRIEFSSLSGEVEFELRADGELRVRSDG